MLAPRFGFSQEGGPNPSLHPTGPLWAPLSPAAPPRLVPHSRSFHALSASTILGLKTRNEARSRGGGRGVAGARSRGGRARSGAECRRCSTSG